MAEKPWYVVAAYLRMSIVRCKREHTYRQMLHWLAYIQNEQQEGFHRYDDYAARILCELRGIRDPKKRHNWKDFLIKFVFRDKKKTPVQSPELTKLYLHMAMGIIDDKREKLKHGNGTPSASSGSG